MTEDERQIRQFKESRSEEAFSSLVNRHLGLVYSIACRQVGGDAHLASDVCQVVFATLARKAATFGPEIVLTGWLYRCALFEAKNLMRRERRRRIREMEAHLMNEMTCDGSSTIDWDSVRPILDEVMGELNVKDRGVICLRFFENQGYAEIGTRLGISENASRMRVSRALDKLNGKLLHRGVKSATAAVGLAVAGQAAISAPAGLSGLLTQTALGGMAAVGGGSVLGTAIGFMNTTKVTVGGVSLISLLVVGTMVYQLKQLSLAGEILEGLRERRAELSLPDDRIIEMEAEISARNGDLVSLRSSRLTADSSHGFEVEDFEAALERWAIRTDNLAEFLSLNQEYRIPEIGLLEAGDWLEATKNAELRNEAEYRNALLDLRSKAKYKVSKKISDMLLAFSEGTGRKMPDNVQELSEYTNDSIVKEALSRYEILSAGDVFPNSRIGDDEAVFYEQQVVDPIWNAKYHFNSRGGLGFQPSGGTEALSRISEAISTFEAANGRTPDSAGELETLIETESDLALLPEIFEAIRTPVQIAEASERDG